MSKLSEEQQQKIDEVLNSRWYNVVSLYPAGRIPADKFAVMYEKFPEINGSEDVVLLYNGSILDGAIFGGMKNGLILTTTKLYAFSSKEKNRSWKIDEIEKIVRNFGPLGDRFMIHLNSGEVVGYKYNSTIGKGAVWIINELIDYLGKKDE